MNNLFVIYGENKTSLNLKLKEILQKNKNKSVIKYDLEETTLEEVIIEAATYSLFEEEKVIVCSNADFLSGSKTDINTDELVKYLENPNENNSLIFLLNKEKMDERKKIVKQLKKTATIIKCEIDKRDMKNQVADFFKELDYKISGSTIDYFLDRVNNKPSRVFSELDKLKFYKLDEKEITKEDVELLVTKELTDTIFDLIDNLVKNNKSKSLKIYRELKAAGEEPLKILVMLANQYRLILQVKRLSKAKYSEKEMAAVLKKHPYAIKLAKEKGYNINSVILKDKLIKLAELDYSIKTGKIDKDMGFELFIMTN